MQGPSKNTQSQRIERKLPNSPGLYLPYAALITSFTHSNQGLRALESIIVVLSGVPGSTVTLSTNGALARTDLRLVFRGFAMKIYTFLGANR